MTAIENSGSNAQRTLNPIAEIIVKGAIAVVTAAFFIAAYLQFDVAFWLAVISAISVYIALLMLHALFRRSQRVDALVNEVTRLETEVSHLKGGEPGLARPVPAQMPAPRPEMPIASSSWDAAPPPPLRRSPDATPPPPPRRSPDAPRPAPKAAVAPTLPTPTGSGPASEQPGEPGIPHWPGTSVAPDPMNDFWAFRPTKQALPEVPSAAPKAAPPARSDAPQPSQPHESDLEAVQGMIEKLAGELGIGEDPSRSGSPAIKPEQQSGLEASVGALHSTAKSMRAAAAKVLPAARRRQNAGPPPPPIATAHTRVSALAEAIALGRMDVLLEPVLGLADKRARHYEVVVRLAGENGAVLTPSANDGELAKTGLLPLLDSARVKRASQVAHSLAQTGGNHLVFCAAAGESLAFDQFLDEFAGAYREREELADQLVLTFPAADVRGFSGVEWRTLSDMRELGFRFGLDNVTDFGLEFRALQAAGFAFAKIGAGAFEKGLKTSNGPVTGSDIGRYLTKFGITPIAGKIDDEAARAKVSDFGVQLGQGRLFGGLLSVAPPNLPRAGIAAA